MHILITGGAGYIGSHTAYALLKAGHQVSIVDNFYSGKRFVPSVLEKIGQVKLYELDLADDLDNVFSACKKYFTNANEWFNKFIKR